MAESMEGKTALEVFSMGTRAYWLHKYSDAALYLSRTSEMMVEEYKDDKHNNLGNVYLYYGKTLLELARLDGDPLGENVPKKVEIEGEEGEDDDGSSSNILDEPSDDEENGEVVDSEEQNADTAMDEGDGNEEVEAMNTTDISINGEAATSSSTEVTASEEEKAGDAESDEKGDDAGEGGSGNYDPEGGSGEKTEEEEPTDLQLAWEVLELAKIIFKNRGDEGREDFADCLVTLGEVSLENESFESAITDISAGLEIQKEIYKEFEDLRKLAETYYKLGMAYTAHNKIDEGIAQYESTMKILKERLRELNSIETKNDNDKVQIKEIMNLIPELEEKVSDLKGFKDETEKKTEEEDKPMPTSPEKKVNNISHLVKRKRKIDEVADEIVGNTSKKPSI